MKSSSLRSSLDNVTSVEDSSPFSTASPKAIETVRQITRLETPLKKMPPSSQPVSGIETPKRTYNYGFTVTPFDSKTYNHNLKKDDSPSAEELLRRLANTREQFQQTLNAERTSPKILAKSIEDEWKGMSDFLKQPASPFTSSKMQQQQKYAQLVSLDDQVSETESLQLKNSIATYEDTKTRLECIRQKSKEMLNSSSSSESLGGNKLPWFGRNFAFFTFLLFMLLTALYFVFFDEKLVLQVFEYRLSQANFFFRTLELPPLAYEDFYAKLSHYLKVAQEYAELSIEWARDKFDL